MPGLNSATYVTSGVKIGEYSLSRELTSCIPGGKVPLRPNVYNFAEKEVRQIKGWSRGMPWDVDEEKMVLQNGHERMWFEAGSAWTVSVLAAIEMSEDSKEFSLHKWEADQSWSKKIVRIEPGEVDADTMLQHQKDEATPVSTSVRLTGWLLTCIGMWSLLWPSDALAPPRWLCGTLVIGTEAWPSLTELGQCWYSMMRAVILGSVGALLAARAGWLVFDYGPVVAALSIGFTFCLAGGLESGFASLIFALCRCIEGYCSSCRNYSKVSQVETDDLAPSRIEAQEAEMNASASVMESASTRQNRRWILPPAAIIMGAFILAIADLTPPERFS
jgi:hypothetical protein